MNSPYWSIPITRSFSCMVLKEIQSTYPLSVTMKEKVDSLREWARQRAVPAN